MFRSRSWFGGGWGKPKNAHSLEHLKYLHNVLAKNQNVSEQNRGLLVESLRFIAEILIWGDQNDSSVFDFFLEKNMLSYFLRIMRQRSGGSSFVCVQLLQTLNILFENIRNETSLYYLLSNNHVNSIIVHKFDFSDEEVMAYYISFLKTLSLKLNCHTIHFFYNEHTKDFPLYTEAIKFFNHPETMVRIAVRTLTLNVYRVQDASMLRFIRDRTAAPYFSNLVWFIGKHVLELDSCVRNDADHQSQRKLDDFVAEHLDHLHYINDILCLDIPDLNDVLTEHLLHKLFIPLYIYSLTTDSTKPPLNNLDPENREHIQNIEQIRRNLAALLKHKSVELSPEKQSPFQSIRSDSREESKPSVSCVVSLFLLSQVFLIITHGPIVHALAWIILQSDMTVFDEGATKILEMYLNNKKACIKLEFSKPSITLEKALECSTATYHLREYRTSCMDRGADVNIDSADQSSCDLDPDLVSNSLPSTSQVSVASSVRHESTEDLITEVSNEDNDISDTSLTLANEVPKQSSDSALPESANVNITDEEKEKIASVQVSPDTIRASIKGDTLEARLRIELVEIEKKPFLKTVFDSMDCLENDYKALFALCLIFALINNKGVNTELLDQLLHFASCPESEVGEEKRRVDGEDAPPSPVPASPLAPNYNALFLDRLLSILNLSCKPNSKVRLVTLELVCVLLGVALGVPARWHAQTSVALEVPTPATRHVHTALAKATRLLQAFYKSDDIFLDMFEDEYSEMCKRPLNVEWLCMDAAILLPPTRTPMSGIAFAKRLPSGEVERARRAIRGYFLIRSLWLKLTGKLETQLPLSYPTPFEQVGNVLDLTDSDLISCEITQKDGTWQHRFLAIYPTQIILVEPDKQRLGWGVAKLVGGLQDLEIQGDKEDPRCLHLTIHKPTSAGGGGSARSAGAGTGSVRVPLLRAKFKFDDHIRSMAAKQRLTKGRTKSRQKKMQQIARLLELPGASMSRAGVASVSAPRSHKPLFTAAARHPGFAALRRESTGSPESADVEDGSHRPRPARPTPHFKEGVVVYRNTSATRDTSGGRGSRSGSRDASPHPCPRPEDIPLAHIRSSSSHSPVPLAPTTIQSHPHLGSGHTSRSSSVERSAPTLTRKSSEETSFIAHTAKRKGHIETV